MPTPVRVAGMVPSGRCTCSSATVTHYYNRISRSLLRSAAQQMQLSSRTYYRLLKVGRTIADLACSKRIQTAHLAEAIQYRQRKM